ncbi:MAG: S-layer homology domain-containing protein, partial [Clostridiales Family XIII bacterium]|nr:S-layer homology domain-containing protein [Clostridiales Family XIII bacterium]
TAAGGDGGAGIGGGDNTAGGVVTINGGAISADGGNGAAGIGGGEGGEGGAVKIGGGTINAAGKFAGKYVGADIGGGSGGAGGTIKITGGSVNASTVSDGPTNGSVNVYRTVLTFAGKTPVHVSAAEAGGAAYGSKDVKTDAAGKLYFYLPARDYAIGELTVTTTGGAVYANANAVSIPLPTDRNTAVTLKRIPAASDFSKFAGGIPTDRIYDGAPQGVGSATAPADVTGMGTATVYYTGTGDPNYTRSETAPADAGRYTVSVGVAESGTYAAAADIPLGAYTIAKYTPRVTLNAANSGADVSLTAGVAKAENDAAFPAGTVTFRKNGAIVDGGANVAVNSSTGEAVCAFDAGGDTAEHAYTAVFTSASGNYNDAASNEVRHDYAKSDQSRLSVHGLNASHTYGDGPIAVTVVGGDGDGAVSVVSSAPEVASVKGSGTNWTVTVHNAGAFDLYASKAGDNRRNPVNAAPVSVTVLPAEITGFAPVDGVNAGAAGSTAYASGAAISAHLLTARPNVTVNWAGGKATIPVAEWKDTGGYNPNAAGSYIFTAVLGKVANFNTGTHTATVTVTVTKASGGSGGGSRPSSGTTTPKKPPVEKAPALAVEVDGKSVEAAEVSVTKEATVVKTTQDVIDLRLQSATENMTITAPANAFDKGTLETRLVVKNIADMAKKNMTLTIVADGIICDMPASAVDTAAALAALGCEKPEEAPFSVKITKPDGAEKLRVAASLSAADASVVGNPVRMAVAASYQGKTYETKVFGAYVSLDIEVSGEDAAGIATALVAEDGRHVPTYVYEKNGRHYAKINSVTNSTYILIRNSQTFTDDDGEWYEDTIEEMAGRRIVYGVGNGRFEGRRNITRAEYAALAVRALGLPAVAEKSGFADVQDGAWYGSAVNTAHGYGLVTGRGDGAAFDPNALITRREALLMTERAGGIAGLADASGLMNDGRADDAVTRAESVTLLLRVLQKSGLVDKRTDI